MDCDDTRNTPKQPSLLSAAQPFAKSSWITLVGVARQ